jgi:hypothetical protein
VCRGKFEGAIRMPLEENSANHHDPDEMPDKHQVVAVRLTDFGGYDKIKVNEIPRLHETYLCVKKVGFLLLQLH